MKFPVIIAGGRDFDDYTLLCNSLEFMEWIGEPIVYSGNANGADKLGERYCRDFGYKLLIFPADWNSFGKKAGFLRNCKMAETAKTLIAFWNGKSKGTKHMIDIALEEGLEVHVFRYGED